MRHHRAQPRDFSNDKAESFFDVLDLRAVEAAFRLFGLPPAEWPERTDDLLFLEDITASERGVRTSYDAAADYPESLLRESDED